MCGRRRLGDGERGHLVGKNGCPYMVLFCIIVYMVVCFVGFWLIL